MTEARDLNFKGKTALITGGGRGIGAATARLLARRGCRVAVLSRTASEVEAVAREIAGLHGADRVLALVGDVSDPHSVDQAFARIKSSWRTLDILVNNAGAIARAPLTEMSLETWEKVIGVNLRGTFLCSKHAFLLMREAGTGGSVVNLSSLSGIRSTVKFEGFSAYAAAKSGVVGLTEALSVEGKPLGIRVNCVAPGAVDTVMLRSAAPSLKTKTRPEDIAEVIVYLCDPERSRPLTGAVIEVNSNE